MRTPSLPKMSLLITLLPLGCGSGRAALGDGGTVNSIAVTCTSEGCTLRLSISLDELQDRADTDGLSVSDFAIPSAKLAREDGAAAPVVEDARPEDIDYTSTGEHLQVPILLDQSGSILVTDPDDERLEGARAVIDDTLGSGGGDDRVAVLGFPRTENALAGELGSLEDTDIWHPFSNDPDSLKEALDRMADSEGNYTPIYDSIIETVHYMDTELDREGATRAVVVMTDGADSESSASAHQVLDEVKLLDIPLYVVALDGPRSTNTTVDYSEIRDLAIDSGGLFIPSDIKSLRATIADITGALYSDVVMTIYLDFEKGSPALEAQQWYEITGKIVYLDELVIPLDERFYVDQIQD